MNIKVGDKIISKKNHPCGANEWEVVRTGADCKIKCVNCGHVLFLSYDEVKKMTKKLKTESGDNDKNS